MSDRQVEDRRTAPIAWLTRHTWSVWAIALAAAAVIAANLAQLVLPLLVPGDGWAYTELAWRPDQPQWVAVRRLANGPTPLQAGDQVVAIEGRALDERLNDAFALRPQRPAGWAAGGSVQYEIVRDGERLSLNVPLRRLTLREAVAAAWPRDEESLLVVVLPLTLLIGIFVFWRRPELAAARLLLVFCAAFATGFIQGPVLIGTLMVTGLSVLPHALSIWQLALLPSLLHLLLVLPVVKQPLRRWPVLGPVVLYGSGQALIWAGWALNWGEAAAVLGAYFAVVGVHGMVFLGGMVATMAHSWWAVRGSIARAQLAWMTFGLVVGFVGSSLLWMLATFLFTFSAFWDWIAALLPLAVPIGLAMAILRYRLFDIDVIVNRALVYSALTALLAAAYFGVVVVLQTTVRLVLGVEQSQLVTVLSTLAIAALFTPLRRRVQTVIDRRFYRRKYDAARTLATFSSTIRDDVDLSQLSERLQAVVQDAMQPAHVNLWLKPPPERRG